MAPVDKSRQPSACAADVDGFKNEDFDIGTTKLDRAWADVHSYVSPLTLTKSQYA